MKNQPRDIIKSITPPIFWTLVRKLHKHFFPSRAYMHGKGVTNTEHGRFHHLHLENFRCLYTDYFLHEKYRFNTDTPAPVIIDGGANIGVGCRYWKFLYPDSEVIAFEPDETNYVLLQENMADIPGFKAKKEALWSQPGSLNFNAAGGEGGHIAATNPHFGKSDYTTVQAFRLRDLLVRKIDLLKLDIEGSEFEVLRDCSDLLTNVEKMFVEHHSFVKTPQKLGEFLGILENAGFRVNIQDGVRAAQPFIKRQNFNNKDLWLNIFCFRE